MKYVLMTLYRAEGSINGASFGTGVRVHEVYEYTRYAACVSCPGLPSFLATPRLVAKIQNHKSS